MVLQKVHGLHATSMTLHERFSMLKKVAPDRVLRQKRAASVSSTINQRYNYSNRLIDQVARQLEMQAKRSLKQRLGFPQPGLRRFGSESSLAGLKRSNSFGNLSQQSVKNRVAWRQSNGNLSRAASFNNLVNLTWRTGARPVRGLRKRGGGPRVMRGRFRNGRQGVPRQAQADNRVQRRGVQRRGVQRRGVQPRRGTPRGGQQRQHGQNTQMPALARRGAARGGRGRGGMTRSQSQPRLLSKEELDAQLEEYMSCTKGALDKELDNYMKNAMEFE